MDPISIPDLVKAVRGRWLGQDPPPADPVLAVSTDSRHVASGSLFAPLQGKNFDGRRFVAEALDRGARAALVEPGVPSGAPPEAPLIEVRSALAALESLATRVRDDSGAECLAVTGTVGKTTTKDFLGVLLATRFPTVRAPRSF